MTLEELYEFADDWYKFSCKPTVQKYGKAHVFDENKSVKWNKEEVERRNKLHDEEVKQLQKEKNTQQLLNTTNNTTGMFVVYVMKK